MRSALAVATLGLLLAAGAQAQTLVATSNILVRALDRSLDFTSDTTTSIRDLKVVQAARDDAASFVASDGAIRGAQLEAALRVLRERLPEARQASDAELGAGPARPVIGRALALLCRPRPGAGRRGGRGAAPAWSWRPTA